jgi:hypothetical protein
MTTSDWEPPLAGTEAEQLVGALHRLRTTFRWKVDDLDATGLRARVGASALTLGGLLKHLALIEDYVFTTTAADDTPEQLYTIWDETVERSRGRLSAALADDGLSQPVHASRSNGVHASLRRLVCDLIEEYSRHLGHADLLREAVDGLSGEDPPAGWRPRAGHYRVCP